MWAAFSQLQKLGSIAASPRTGPQPRKPPFSQLQKLGSIAAKNSTKTPARPPTFPSSKSWAPLRVRGHAGLAGVRQAFPSSKSWAPLRTVDHMDRVDCLDGLFPAPKAGLHCGLLGDSAIHRGQVHFSQLQKLGSIAGTRAKSSRSSGPTFSQLQKLGSIAGALMPRLLSSGGSLFPAPKAGLHCGSFLTEKADELSPAFPSSKSWAPLRVVVLQRLDLRLRLYIMANRPLWLLIFSTVDINSTFLLCYKLVCRRLGGLFC